VLPIKQIKEEEIGAACGRQDREEKNILKLLVINFEGKTGFENPDVNVRIIFGLS
jgi:hypothetical protein